MYLPQFLSTIPFLIFTRYIFTLQVQVTNHKSNNIYSIKHLIHPNSPMNINKNKLDVSAYKLLTRFIKSSHNQQKTQKQSKSEDKVKTKSGVLGRKIRKTLMER